MTRVPGCRRCARSWRRVVSTRLWWALLIPVAVLAVLVNLFGGLLGDGLGDAGGDLPVLPASVAFTLTLTAVFAAVYGTVAAAGEFRHRTVTTAYLTAGGRGRVLVGKLVAGAGVGALYAVVAVPVGVAAGLLGQGAGRVSGAGALVGVAAVGVAVAALWGAIGRGGGRPVREPGGRARRAAGVPADRRAGAGGGAEQLGLARRWPG